MNDLISRQAAYDTLTEYYHGIALNELRRRENERTD